MHNYIYIIQNFHIAPLTVYPSVSISLIFSSCLCVCISFCTVKCVFSWREEHHRQRWMSRVMTPWVLLSKLPTQTSSPCEWSHFSLDKRYFFSLMSEFLINHRTLTSSRAWELFEMILCSKSSCWKLQTELILCMTEILNYFIVSLMGVFILPSSPLILFSPCWYTYLVTPYHHNTLLFLRSLPTSTSQLLNSLFIISSLFILLLSYLSHSYVCPFLSNTLLPLSFSPLLQTASSTDERGDARSRSSLGSTRSIPQQQPHWAAV